MVFMPQSVRFSQWVVRAPHHPLNNTGSTGYVWSLQYFLQLLSQTAAKVDLECILIQSLNFHSNNYKEHLLYVNYCPRLKLKNQTGFLGFMEIKYKKGNQEELR